MATTQAGIVLRHLRGLAATGRGDRVGDAELLERFARRHEGPAFAALVERFLRGHDPASFAALVRRHGPMVLRVCRRVLRHHQDAEDAFQATFLTLARKAGGVRRGASVRSWLYRVAYHTALRSRASAATRRAHEHRSGGAPAADPLAEVTGRELLTVLDEDCSACPSNTGLR